MASPSVALQDEFARAAEELRPRLLATARRLLRDREEAEDAVQDGLASAWRALDRFRGESRLSSWMHRIVINAALMRLRARKRRAELLAGDESEGPLGAVANREPSPEVVAGDREAAARALARIPSLPEPQRLALVARGLDGLATSEAADALGTTTSALKIRLFRARAALRRQLEAA